MVSTHLFSPAAMLAAQKLGAKTIPLPVSGIPFKMTSAFTPALFKGLTFFPEHPLKIGFIVDQGKEKWEDAAFTKEAERMIKYFMTTLTVPDEEMWVNLSPHEPDLMMAEGLGKTLMGRDLLAQDYLLKQLMASLTYPEGDLGREFWGRVYRRAALEFGTTDIPMELFNKVWIVPHQAKVYVQGTSVFVMKSRLKVMLEEDYVGAGPPAKPVVNRRTGSPYPFTAGQISSATGWENPASTPYQKTVKSIIKEILIPEIEKEINEGRTFAPLRQIYHAMILATWYKKNLKEGLFARLYVDQNKTLGVDVKDRTIKDKIYARYMEAFKRGAYNYIREDVDPVSLQMLPRKYFSGGYIGLKPENLTETLSIDQSELSVLPDGDDHFIEVDMVGVSEHADHVLNVLEMVQATYQVFSRQLSLTDSILLRKVLMISEKFVMPRDMRADVSVVADQSMRVSEAGKEKKRLEKTAYNQMILTLLDGLERQAQGAYKQVIQVLKTIPGTTGFDYYPKLQEVIKNEFRWTTDEYPLKTGDLLMISENNKAKILTIILEVGPPVRALILIVSQGDFIEEDNWRWQRNRSKKQKYVKLQSKEDRALINEETVKETQTPASPALRTTPGGIDLNPATLDLVVERDARGMPLPVDQQPIGSVTVDGFVPVIINIRPFTPSSQILGDQRLSSKGNDRELAATQRHHG